MPVTDVERVATAVLEAVGSVVVGKRDTLRLVLAGIFAGGHVLLEDLPGLGKTLTARSFAQVLGLGFRRLQFTPDLLPADVTGSFLYDQRSHDFSFRAGPIFTNLLLADEINRTPPKTQAALLEAMQERQVTVEGTTYALQPPFHVLATANPIEYEGTYPLPEAQLDRFLLRVSFGYPDRPRSGTCSSGGWRAGKRRRCSRRWWTSTLCARSRLRSRTWSSRIRSGSTWSS
jgi:MoxR-like ATPase